MPFRLKATKTKSMKSIPTNTWQKFGKNIKMARSVSIIIMIILIIMNLWLYNDTFIPIFRLVATLFVGVRVYIGECLHWRMLPSENAPVGECFQRRMSKTVRGCQRVSKTAGRKCTHTHIHTHTHTHTRSQCLSVCYSFAKSASNCAISAAKQHATDAVV